MWSKMVPSYAKGAADMVRAVTLALPCRSVGLNPPLPVSVSPCYPSLLLTSSQQSSHHHKTPPRFTPSAASFGSIYHTAVSVVVDVAGSIRSTSYRRSSDTAPHRTYLDYDRFRSLRHVHPQALFAGIVIHTNSNRNSNDNGETRVEFDSNYGIRRKLYPCCWNRCRCEWGECPAQDAYI